MILLYTSQTKICFEALLLHTARQYRGQTVKGITFSVSCKKRGNFNLDELVLRLFLGSVFLCIKVISKSLKFVGRNKVHIYSI